MAAEAEICVIGLGYVGLPLAVGLSGRHRVIGFDVNAGRIDELKSGLDRNREVDPERLRAAPLSFTTSPEAIVGCGVYIITVPTPVDDSNRPDLGAVRAACRTVGGALRKGAIVVLESTVYPGVTEEICGPALESASGLVCGRDFHLGYSPERINPGDREHTVDRVTKVVAGQTPEVARRLAEVYGSINGNQIFVARDIRTAEAAKVIENAQRDINIAFMNEIAQIVERVDISIWDVLAAARTKWNFLPFEPGLVGGHCIGVDPYYLSHLAEQVGLEPQVVLAGRGKNDSMARWIAERIHERRGGPGTALILGATFKEDVPDLRNSKVFDLARQLSALGHQVRIADPIADPTELAASGFETDSTQPADVLVGAVRHRAYIELPDHDIETLVCPGGLVADIKGMWRDRNLRGDIARWTL